MEERRTYTEKQFNARNGFPAEKKMRLLLAEAKIPTAMPTHLTNFDAHAKHANWQDGPQALTQLRNWITHPTGKDRQNLDRVSLLTRFEACNLALWYLELTLLWLLGYRGDYVNRLNVRFTGDREAVPWAATLPPAP